MCLWMLKHLQPHSVFRKPGEDVNSSRLWGSRPSIKTAWWRGVCYMYLYGTIHLVVVNVGTYIYMRVVLNSFIWKTSSSPKNSFAELSRAPFLSRYMLAKIFKKNVDVWYPQIVPGVWSLVTLHSAAAALKHLRSALLRCWSLLTFIGQFWHNKSTV